MIKNEKDKLSLSQYIKETKITITNHLIITFNDSNNYNSFLNLIKHIEAFNNYQIIDLNKKQRHMIIIKGMNFNSYNGYKSVLKDMGIINILQMNKSNQDFKMIKAECSSAEIREQLIKNGLKLDYFSLKVEEFRPQFKPIQCFNCQNFDHMADKCPKATHLHV